jgi:hypothetical protein
MVSRRCFEPEARSRLEEGRPLVTQSAAQLEADVALASSGPRSSTPVAIWTIEATTFVNRKDFGLVCEPRRRPRCRRRRGSAPLQLEPEDRPTQTATIRSPYARNSFGPTPATSRNEAVFDGRASAIATSARLVNTRNAGTRFSLDS